MLKRLCCLMSLIVGIPFLCTSLPKNATVCYAGKSSGEFSCLTSTLPINTLNRNGVSFTCSKEEAELLVEKLKAKKVHYFSANGVENYYYYSNLISTKEVIFKKRVNIHVAVTNAKVTVGSPLIYYGY